MCRFRPAASAISGLALTLALLASAPVAAHGQQRLSGLVVESEIMVPVPEATVVLLDGGLNAVAQARADAEGRFAIQLTGSGPWQLQAEIAGRFSSLFPAPDPGSAAADSLLLVIPSPLVDLASTCPVSGPDPVLVGIVQDAESGVPVPSVRVSVTWAGRADPVVATTDRSGRYRVCAVPADADVALHVEGLGRQAVSRFRVPNAGFVRADLALELGTGASQLRVLGMTPLAEGAAAEIAGRVRSTDAAEPVTGIAIRRAGERDGTTTDENGRFRLGGMEPGDVVIEIEHIAFGTQREVVSVRSGSRTEVEITLAPRPIALRPIEVTGSAEARYLARAAPHRAAVFSGVRLAEAEARGATVSDLIRQTAGIHVMEGLFTTRNGLESGVCVTSTRAIGSLSGGGVGRPDAPWCDPIPVIVDGIPVSNPVDYLRRLGTGDFESIQILGAMEAQIRFGLSAGTGGAILLWTRGRGPFTSADRNPR
jgi:hypothetical protein